MVASIVHIHLLFFSLSLWQSSEFNESLVKSMF